MTLRTILATLSIFATVVSADRPNIIVIMVDDMGFSDIGCYGSEIPTPHLDKLAANGASASSQFYNTGRCCPTRASLLTGLYSHQRRHRLDDRRPGAPRLPGPAQRPLRHHRRGPRRGRLLHRHDRQVACRLRARCHPLGTRLPPQPQPARGRPPLPQPDRFKGRHQDVPQRRGSRPRRPAIRPAVVRHRPLDRAGHPLHRRGARREQAVLLVPRPRRPALPLHGPGADHRQVPRQIPAGLGQAARGTPCTADRVRPDRQVMAARTPPRTRSRHGIRSAMPTRSATTT